MAFLPVGNNRAPFPLVTQLALGDITARQRALSKVALELSSGRRLNLPSENPGEAIRATLLQRTKEQQLQYQENIRQGKSRLSSVEGVFRSFTDALDSARSIAVTISDGTRSDADYEAARVQVDSLIDQLMTEANKKYLGSYLLAGSNPNELPFRRDGNYITYTGDDAVLQSLQGSGESFAATMTADGSLGTFSAAGRGTDLTPDLGTATRLRELNGGDGVDSGSISLQLGASAPVTVDLSTADNIQDVIDLVNNDPTLSSAGFTIGIAASGDRLAVLTGPVGTVTIDNVGGGSTARDLGIQLSGATIPASGGAITPAVVRTTPLALLNGGAGVDTSQPLVIENGPYSASIDLSGAVTIEDVLNEINAAGVRVKAEINSDGTGINVRSTLAGASFRIVENSQTGSVAQDLGILTTRLDTPLADFNGGAGVDGREGADLQIAVADGSTYQIDLSSATTLADVRQIIESETAGAVTVSINPQGGLILDDTTSGSGSFSVQNIDESQAASDLGIAGTTAGGGTILGTDTHEARVKGIFDTLLRLRDGLAARDQGEIGVAAQQIAQDQNRILGASGALGARLQALDALDDRITTDLEQVTLDTTNLIDADLSETVTKLALEQTALQAALASSGRLLQGSLLDFI